MVAVGTPVPRRRQERARAASLRALERRGRPRGVRRYRRRGGRRPSAAAGPSHASAVCLFAAIPAGAASPRGRVPRPPGRGLSRRVRSGLLWDLLGRTRRRRRPVACWAVAPAASAETTSPGDWSRDEAAGPACFQVAEVADGLPISQRGVLRILPRRSASGGPDQRGWTGSIALPPLYRPRVRLSG